MENLIAPHNEYPSKKIDDLVQRADWGYAVAIVPSPSPSPVTADNSEGQPCTGHVPASFPTSVIIKNSEIVDSPVIDLFDPTALPTKPTDTPHTSTESANYVNVVGMGSHVLVPELIPISKLPISDEILALTGGCNREGDRRRTIVASPLWRTGTWPWISAQSIVTNPGEPVIYETYHDLESFFYVLLGTCLLLKEPSKFKGEDELGLCFNKFSTSLGRPDLSKLSPSNRILRGFQ
ncbi:hypothetical protein EDC04DRAFT_2903726 [Pisolithus marmoratus]|nr:hypothetical protein EDC04DRAFT_2903726 [Pisolithus marmoratus]